MGVCRGGGYKNQRFGALLHRAYREERKDGGYRGTGEGYDLAFTSDEHHRSLRARERATPDEGNEDTLQGDRFAPRSLWYVAADSAD